MDELLNDVQREMLPRMLRSADGQRSYEYLWRMCRYAANEIERLREENAQLRKWISDEIRLSLKEARTADSASPAPTVDGGK